MHLPPGLFCTYSRTLLFVNFYLRMGVYFAWGFTCFHYDDFLSLFLQCLVFQNTYLYLLECHPLIFLYLLRAATYILYSFTGQIMNENHKKVYNRESSVGSTIFFFKLYFTMFMHKQENHQSQVLVYVIKVSCHLKKRIWNARNA